MSAPATATLLTRKQLARRLKINPARLASPDWRRRAGIPTLRIGGALRFDPSAVESWLRAQAQTGGAA